MSSEFLLPASLWWCLRYQYLCVYCILFQSRFSFHKGLLSNKQHTLTKTNNSVSRSKYVRRIMNYSRQWPFCLKLYHRHSRFSHPSTHIVRWTDTHFRKVTFYRVKITVWKDLSRLIALVSTCKLYNNMYRVTTKSSGGLSSWKDIFQNSRQLTGAQYEHRKNRNSFPCIKASTYNISSRRRVFFPAKRELGFLFQHWQKPDQSIWITFV